MASVRPLLPIAARGARVLLLGMPGAGKGTYGGYLSRECGLPLLSSGDLLRAEIAARSDVGVALEARVRSGQLVDDAVVSGVVLARLRGMTASGWILDGYPRSVRQAAALQAEAAPPQVAVLLELPRAIVFQKILGRRACGQCGASFNVAHIVDDTAFMPAVLPRVPGVCDKCGGALRTRSDDNAATLNTRLAVYDAEIAPLRAFYESRNMLTAFDVRGGFQRCAPLLRAHLFGDDGAGGREREPGVTVMPPP